MSKSTLPPNQDQKKYHQDGDSSSGSRKGQENQSNRGYEEDQPENPVRTTGSNRPDQESDIASRGSGPASTD